MAEHNLANDLIIDLDTRSYPGYSTLISQLADRHYTRVNMVLEAGEFAVRGSIIDVFPTNQSHPIRIEYSEDDIERLATMDIHSQRSLSVLTGTRIVDAETKADLIQFSVAVESADLGLISDLEAGDYVVHEHHGIGLYQGLFHMTIGRREGEYLLIQYKGEDRLYVPLEQMQKIHRYSGSELKPKINGLSDGIWQRSVTRARRATLDLALDLYDTQKNRIQEPGFAFQEDTVWQIELEHNFPFQPTPDQLRITEEVKRDMEEARPMDRLICGDVGYGKTEIAIRAAFKAVENEKQVAILTPTTILAEQHYRSFKARFDPYSYRVEMLSRFRTKDEQRAIIKDLKHDHIQVIVGTHRLLQKDIAFHDLGLLIIDEEQRFGVTHKERIKALKQNVDIITITATPIPRTLYMSLTGAKDFSLLETAPENRKPVLTAVTGYQDKTVKNAIEAELKRKGQVYYVFNSIEKMPGRLAHLTKLLPGVRFACAHGRMNAEALDRVFTGFTNAEYDVLVATTIIENGIDIPNVNTMIIEQAENFGLSQIHQLRGRVGRIDRQAYCYLLHNPGGILSDKARKRLTAIKEYASLGAGYKLAMKDLEIRGAGTLLGEKQSGHMTAIGFELYCRLLEDAVTNTHHRKIRERPIITLDPELKTLIPESYVENPRERLALYQRLMNAEVREQIDEIRNELEDRYGTIPELVIHLLMAIRAQLH